MCTQSLLLILAVVTVGSGCEKNEPPTIAEPTRVAAVHDFWSETRLRAYVEENRSRPRIATANSDRSVWNWIRRVGG